MDVSLTDELGSDRDATGIDRRTVVPAVRRIGESVGFPVCAEMSVSRATVLEFVRRQPSVLRSATRNMTSVESLVVVAQVLAARVGGL